LITTRTEEMVMTFSKRQPGEQLFDYPVSMTFRGYEAQLEGIPEPEGYGRISSYPEPEIYGRVSSAPEPVNEIALRRRIGELQGQLNFLQNKLNEHLDATKKAQKKREQQSKSNSPGFEL